MNREELTIPVIIEKGLLEEIITSISTFYSNSQFKLLEEIYLNNFKSDFPNFKSFLKQVNKQYFPDSGSTCFFLDSAKILEISYSICPSPLVDSYDTKCEIKYKTEYKLNEANHTLSDR